MNITEPNFTAFFEAPEGECIKNGIIQVNCVYEHICNQLGTHFRHYGIGLIIGFVVIDAVLPWLLRGLAAWVDWDKIYYNSFAVRWQLGDIRDHKVQDQIIIFLKERLLFGCIVYVALILFL